MHLGDVLALRAASRVVAERRLVAQRVRAVILREKGVHVSPIRVGRTRRPRNRASERTHM